MTNAALHVARTGLDAQDDADARHRQQSGQREHDRLQARPRRVRDARLSDDDRAGRALVRRQPYAIGPQPRHRRPHDRHRADRRRRARSTPPTTRSTSRSRATAISRSPRPDGTIGYTRAGNFHLSAEGKLVTSDGMPLQPEIQIPEGATSITIGSDGTVSATLAGPDRGDRARPDPDRPLRQSGRPAGARRQSLSRDRGERRGADRRRRRARAAARSARARSKARTSTSSRSWST